MRRPHARKQRRVKIISLLKIFNGKHQPRNIGNTNFFENEMLLSRTFLKTKYFSSKIFQNSVDTTFLKQPRGLTQKSSSRWLNELGVVPFLRMRIPNNGLNQRRVISIRAVDQKQDKQLDSGMALYIATIHPIGQGYRRWTRNKTSSWIQEWPYI